MAGRRILDLAAIVNASRVVAKSHIALRTQQAEVYNQTSSLTQAVRQRAVPVTARSSTNSPSPIGQHHEDTPIPRPDTVGAADSRTRRRPEGLDQDHFYKPSETNSTAQPVSEQALRIGQEPSNQPSSPADTARRLQRRSEAQIPSTAAQAIGSTESAYSKLSQGHDRDVYYAPSTHQSDVLSSLPRAKIPKQSADRQGGDAHVDGGKINADVFYSTSDKQGSRGPASEVQEQFQDQEEEGVNTAVFSSPRVAKLLGGKAISSEQDNGRETQAVEDVFVEQRESGELRDGDTLHAQTNDQHQPAQASSEQRPSPEEDIINLAQDLTSDATAPDPPPAYQLRESRVPSSRIGRLWQYGSLATSMAFGAASESVRRATGTPSTSPLMLSPANTDRLVAKLSRMRGAALKLGQMLSFQDSQTLPPAISTVMQRVQDSADYMPSSQRNAVLASSLSPSWPSLFSSFTDTPLAAASIGQVHAATLAATDTPVAVKIQYPGVADSISSDLSNLSLLLTASRLLPKGLYLDHTIANARTELAWECDYEREAACAKRYASLLFSPSSSSPSSSSIDESTIFSIPSIIDAASGPRVLTMTMMSGTPITKLPDSILTQSLRDHIGTSLLRLCLREITEWRFMQTDPNWTNFLWNSSTRRIELLDFGACREYPTKFIVPYTNLLQAAAQGDHARATELSVQLGYLTGHESKRMREAHLESLFTLAEPFREGQGEGEVYDFRDQTITERVRGLVPVMLRERLGPPPEETYSLHRKLSGAFLLCARLGSRVECRKLWVDAMARAGLE